VNTWQKPQGGVCFFGLVIHLKQSKLPAPLAV
jgi:hypothetical protein